MGYRRRGPGAPMDNSMPAELSALCARWALRALIELGAVRSIVREEHCTDVNLLEFLGVDGVAGQSIEGNEVIARVRKQHRQAMAEPIELPAQCALVDNIIWLGDELGLDEVAQSILLFCVLEARCAPLRSAIEAVGELNESQVSGLLSVLLDAPLPRVSEALAPDAGLAGARLLVMDESSNYVFASKLEMIRGLAERMMMTVGDRYQLFAGLFTIAPPASLGVERFAHLGNRVRHLCAYLAQALADGTRGCNVLVYGPPGTGKTELARTLAHELGATLF